ncbi:uncharacterized protein [Triticum aestivum]|uniref:uncharacterized protein n=1 Tax=Triticum aestivum TaxID=4565 RepID=UPI001D017758|nr:uncharacterized protein LOC123185317 [Triticum aestivum]
MPAASGDLRRRAACPKLPTVRASLPSIQTLCSRPLQPARNHTPMARVRAWLRRRVSDGPNWGTPWEFPIHHGRRRQGILQGDVKDTMDMQLLKRRITDSQM